MGIDEEKLFNELENWDDLISELPRVLAPGEKTLVMIARLMGVDRKTAEKQIAEWIEKGILEDVGERRTKSGKICKAYKRIGGDEKNPMG